jgi:voltage-gated potassium channel
MSLRELRKKAFLIVEPSSSYKDPHFVFDIFIIILIIVNVLALILESVPEFLDEIETEAFVFEVFSVVVFTIEYLIRIWTTVEKPGYEHPVSGRLKWMMRPIAIVDLLAILPFYLPFVGIDLRFIRVFRTLRIIRIFKIARYTNAFDTIKTVLKNKKEEIMISVLFVFILLIVASTFMYYAERDAQPDVFGTIPEALWWGVVTLTTVGYGDTVPVTVLGKILAGIISLMGIGLIALPTGILASGFSEEVRKNRSEGH